MMRVFFCSMVLFFFGFHEVEGQICRVPKAYNFRSVNDYENHSENIYLCMDFLAAKPIHEDRALRSEALIYVLTWLQGSPQVTVRTYSELLIFEEECPDLVPELIYLLAREMRVQERQCDALIHLTALKNLISLYKKSEGLRCPSLEKLAVMNDSELENWVFHQYRLAVGEH